MMWRNTFRLRPRHDWIVRSTTPACVMRQQERCWWIHSAYPNYDLDTTYGPQSYSPAALTTDDPAKELGELIMGNLPSFVESAYIDGSFSSSELASFLGKDELKEMWLYPTPRPTPSPVSREPSFCPWIRNLYYRYGGSRGRYSWLARSRYYGQCF